MRIPAVFASVSLTCFLSGWALGSEPPPAGWKQASALLESYCFTCHDADTAKGDVVLDGLYDHGGKIDDYELWERALRSIEQGEMPPKKKKQPSPEENLTLKNWIRDSLETAASENAGDPGIVTMRRLTNAEYRHTVRELTSLWEDWSSGFVADAGGGEGFSNTGDVLFTSPEQLEKYLSKAREIANRAAILPGTGITFHKNEIGERSLAQSKEAIEISLRTWYRKQSERFLPKDDEDLRESDYLTACWKWKYRDKTAATSLEDLAQKEGLNELFLKNWWAILSSPQPESRYLKLTTDAFAALPPPGQGHSQSIPPEVASAIASIEKQRKAWYVTKGDWASPQRQQQDADGVRTYNREISLGGEKKVHLLVSDLGDGNEGDFVHWSELRFQWPDGKWDNLFGWLWRSGKETTDEKTKAWFQQYSRLEMGHPRGKKMPKQTFAVHAPSIVTFPVPEGTLRFSAKGRLESDAPNKEKASVQWAIVAGERPKKVASIIPGELTIWHRLTPAHNQLMKEFDVMKQRFPANFDKRAEQVEWNLQRWDDEPFGCYVLTNQQLFSLVELEERKWIERRRIDLGYAGNPRVTQEVAGQWARHLLQDLNEFAERAWRRPLSDGEKTRLQQVYQEARKAEMSREASAREVMVSILVSPHFLFRVEKGNRLEEAPLSQYEYASRLSYFLWSCPPDEELLQSAREGKLLSSDWQVVCDQVDRMLPNYRSFALAQEFGGQWLGFHDLQSLNSIDTEKFPEFDWRLKNLLHAEAWKFLTAIIQERRPVTDIFAAKYTFLNEPLAAHYGIPGVQGEEFRNVDVSNFKRGGILGMGGFHAKTSYPVRTSPVLRGNWILKEVLGRPTPAPPPNIPELESGSGDVPLTLREQLEIHRENATCASCHDKIDPLGFALEKFDPVGRRREKDEQGRLIDDRGETAEGMQLHGIEGLKEWFGKEEDAFLDQFCTKLAGYALGREIQASDQFLIQEMIANMKKWNYSFGAAVKPLVLSRQFKSRRNTP